MECKDPAAYSMDDLLDFEIGGEDDDEDKHTMKALPSLHPNEYGPASFSLLAPDDPSRLIPDGVEEELEWLSNKDAFPEVESLAKILSEHHHGNFSKHQSPVSVLENSTSSSSHSHSHSTNSSTFTSCYLSREIPVPVRARSKRQRKIPIQQQLWWCLQQPNKNAKVEATMSGSTAIGRKCQHCGAEKTPQWRAGPYGPKTLCNACGVRYKSGRLVPEYRPASSPTFSNDLHSNSHRKIMELRRQKHEGMAGDRNGNGSEVCR